MIHTLKFSPLVSITPVYFENEVVNMRKMLEMEKMERYFAKGKVIFP